MRVKELTKTQDRDAPMAPQGREIVVTGHDRLCREQRSARSQPGAPPIFHQLQSAERAVYDFVTDHHRQLEAGSGDKWTVPVGGGFGKVFRIGKLPFNGNISAYANVVRADPGPHWTLRLQIAPLLPKSMF